MEKVVKDGETPAPLITPKTNHYSSKSILGFFHLHKWNADVSKLHFTHIYQLFEENVSFLTVFRKECLVKLFKLSLYCTCPTLCIYEPKDSSAFWFDFKRVQEYFL